MTNFLMRVASFMQGRYGIDSLSKALLVLWLVIDILNTVFIKNVWLGILIWLLVAIVLFRTLSKDIYKRQKENEDFQYYFARVKPFFAKFKPVAKKVSAWFKLQLRKFKDRKTHRYIKCPYCKASIRVPFRKGRHTVNCPRCTVDFKTNIRF